MEVILAEIREMKKRNQTSHPIDVVAACLNKDNVNLLTGSHRDGGSLLMSMNSWKVFQYHEKNLTHNLKKYIRSNFYSKMKFTTEARESTICTMAVNNKAVAIPEPTTKEVFAEYFKKEVPQTFNQLRHNTQTLARINWIGKNFVLQ